MAKFAKPSESKSRRDPNKIIVRVEGEIMGLPDIELNDKKDATFVTIPLEDVIVTRANGDQEEVQKRIQRFPYSRAYELVDNEDGGKDQVPAVVDEDGEPLTPERTSPWNDVIFQALKEVGFDVSNPETLEDAVGRTLVLTRQTVGRTWSEGDERGSDPQTENQRMFGEDGEPRKHGRANVYLSEDETPIIWHENGTVNERGGWCTLDEEPFDGEPNKIQKQYVGLLPESLS